MVLITNAMNKNTWHLLHIEQQQSTREQKLSLAVLLGVFALHIIGLAYLLSVPSNKPILTQKLTPIMVSLISHVSTTAHEDNSAEPVAATEKVNQQPVKIDETKTTVTQKIVAATSNKALETQQQLEKTDTINDNNLKQTPDIALNQPSPAEQVPIQQESVLQEVVPPSFGAAYLENPAPEYPRMSKRAGEQGRVVLNVLVSSNGKPETVVLEKTSGFDRLDGAAIDAVKKWRFNPAKKGNQAISATVLVPIKFDLES